MANTDDTNKNSNDEDNFGLPDIEYKPLEQMDTSKTTEDPEENEPTRVHEFSNVSNESPYEEEEESSGSGRIIGWIIVLVILVGGFLAYRYVYVPKKEKEKQELARQKAEADKKAEDERLAKIAEEERLKREAE